MDGHMNVKFVCKLLLSEDYQGYLLGGKGALCLGLTTLPPSCANCL